MAPAMLAIVSVSPPRLMASLNENVPPLKTELEQNHGRN